MQTNVSATGNKTETEKCDTAAGTSSAPDLVTAEVASIHGELVAIHNKPLDGSALEAASELHKLTEVLSDKAAEIKAMADQAFLGEAEPVMVAIVVANPEALDQLHLHSDVQNAVDELQEKVANIQVEADQQKSPKQAADHAAALDKVAEVLETSSEQIKDLKVALTAKELNNMDGFDR